MSVKHKRVVFFVSDRTGLTAESYGSSLLSQFPGTEFESIKHAFVDNVAQARLSVIAINEASKKNLFRNQNGTTKDFYAYFCYWF